MAKTGRRQAHLGPVLRALIETGFIIFLFYSNLLMGEFTRANAHAHHHSIAAALVDVFTPTNFAIGVVSAVIGYLVVEFLRKRV
ncbi:MAG TPA: hypothetical protein VMU37_05415 [Caulobacteraceae bacterium]|jgi:hypothetical protein|nr:hypothetical protein [Caulobacteraceae bacterium]